MNLENQTQGSRTNKYDGVLVAIALVCCMTALYSVIQGACVISRELSNYLYGDVYIALSGLVVEFMIDAAFFTGTVLFLLYAVKFRKKILLALSVGLIMLVSILTVPHTPHSIIILLFVSVVVVTPLVFIICFSKKRILTNIFVIFTLFVYIVLHASFYLRYYGYYQFYAVVGDIFLMNTAFLIAVNTQGDSVSSEEKERKNALKKRLKLLNESREVGIISEEDYNAQKQEIMKEL